MATYTGFVIPAFASTTTTIILPAPTRNRVTQYRPTFGESEVNAGSDTPVFPDLEPSGAAIGGRRLLADHLMRRLTTPRGSIPMLPDYGIDVRDFLSAKMSPDELYSLRSMVENELKEDERISDASVLATFDRQTETITLECTVEAGSGPFVFTTKINALNIDLLMEG